MFLGYKAKDIVIDFSTRSLFISNDPKIDFLGKHRRQFGDDDNTILIVLKSDKIFTPAFLYMLNSIVNDIKKIKIRGPVLKVDYDERERNFKGYKKNTDKEISKIINKSINQEKKEDDEEIINDDDDDLFEEDTKNKEIVKSIFETPPGEIISPIERVISIINVKNIYGKTSKDGIDDIYISPFLSAPISTTKISNSVKSVVFITLLIPIGVLYEEGVWNVLYLEFNSAERKNFVEVLP